MRRALCRRIVGLSALLGLAGCTLITNADDRKVVEGGEGAARDLRFAFKNMGVHERLALDVAVVNAEDLLQGRARIILPPSDGGARYPDVLLAMQRALVPGAYRLLFHVDGNDNNLVDSTPNNIEEHIWIEDVPPSGSGSFSHSLNFRFFTEQDYSNVGRNIVLEMPGGAVPGEQARLCLRELLDENVQRILEVKFFIDDGRQVAYFATFPGNPLPESITLTGIVDAPNKYTIDVFVDGRRTKSFNRDVQATQGLTIPAAEWFPVPAAGLLTCLDREP
jgi:hypothetical protein